MNTPEYITRKRARYIRSARAEVKKALTVALADYMNRVSNAASLGDFITEANKHIDQKPIQDAVTRIYTRVGPDFAKSTIKSLKTKKSAPDPIELDYWIEFFRMYARSKTANEITLILETSKKIFQETVQKIVLTAGETGMSMFQVAKEIQKQIGFTNQYRAERIARTEIVQAANSGIFEGGKQAGIPVKKEWMPIVDQWSRPDHAAMAGVIIPMDQAFNVGGAQMMQPGDGSLGAGAEHIINCRCSLLIVPDTTYDDIINR